MSSQIPMNSMFINDIGNFEIYELVKNVFDMGNIEINELLKEDFGIGNIQIYEFLKEVFDIRNIQIYEFRKDILSLETFKYMNHLKTFFVYLFQCFLSRFDKYLINM